MSLVLLSVFLVLQAKPSAPQILRPSENHQTTATNQTSRDKKQDKPPKQVSPPPTTYNITDRDKQEPDADKMEERSDRKAQLRLNRIYVGATVFGVLGSWVVLVVLVVQTIATKQSAKAALLNAQAVISADRPWIIVFATR